MFKVGISGRLFGAKVPRNVFALVATVLGAVPIGPG